MMGRKKRGKGEIQGQGTTWIAILLYVANNKYATFDDIRTHLDDVYRVHTPNYIRSQLKKLEVKKIESKQELETKKVSKKKDDNVGLLHLIEEDGKPKIPYKYYLKPNLDNFIRLFNHFKEYDRRTMNIKSDKIDGSLKRFMQTSYYYEYVRSDDFYKECLIHFLKVILGMNEIMENTDQEKEYSELIDNIRNLGEIEKNKTWLRELLKASPSAIDFMFNPHQSDATLEIYLSLYFTTMLDNAKDTKSYTIYKQMEESPLFEVLKGLYISDLANNKAVDTFTIDIPELLNTGQLKPLPDKITGILSKDKGQ